MKNLKQSQDVFFCIPVLLFPYFFKRTKFKVYTNVIYCSYTCICTSTCTYISDVLFTRTDSRNNLLSGMGGNILRSKYVTEPITKIKIEMHNV